MKELYVSLIGNDGWDGSAEKPFATVERAYLELDKTEGDVRINMARGRYPLKETLTFTPELCRDRKITFSGDGAELFGGVSVTEWVKDGDLYKAHLDIKDVRNLYVNTFPAHRSRSKYRYTISDLYMKDGEARGIKVGEKNFPKKFHNWRDMEVLNPWEWECHRFKIADYRYCADTHEYIFEFDMTHNSIKRLGVESKDFYLENDLTFLKEQGSFYYDKSEKTIYYYPYDHEDMATADIYVGAKEMFVNVLGNAENKVKNLTFEGIRFSGGVCNQLSERGYHCSQSDALSVISGELPEDGSFGINTSQFRMSFAENITVKNCEFINMGSAVIAMHDSVKAVKVEGNIFRDSSAVAIRIGHPGHKTAKEGIEVCSDIVVKNNVIARMCGELYSNCAISVYYEKDVRILHNLITDMPYTGVTLSWGWNGAPGYDCHDLEVAHNHIRRVMSVLHDGGAVYTLCGIKKCTIHDNLFEDSKDRGLYNDAGSGWISSYNNVILGCKLFIQVQELKYSTHDLSVYNNFTDAYTTLGPMRAKTVDVKRPVIVDRDRLPDEARGIASRAGVEEEYRYLEKLVEIPEWHRVRTTERFGKPFVSKTDALISKMKKIIEAEDFMEGGEGVGYHKTLTPKRKNNAYRDDEVRMYFNSAVSSYVIQMTEAGEWLNYKYTVPETDEYYIDMVTMPYGDDILAKWYIDGEFLTNVPIVKDGKNYTTVTVGPFPMEKGEHIFKMEFAVPFYFDKFRIYTGKEAPVPEELYYTSDEDFDE